MDTHSTLNRRDEQPLSETLEQRAFVAPAVDIYENAEEVLLVADLPGVGKEDVSIHFEKDRLSLRATRRESPGGRLLAAEYRPHDFRRDFLVPRGIDAERIEAKVEAGVLRVRLPKAAALRPRAIAVKAG
jgi:HSP20 family protein